MQRNIKLVKYRKYNDMILFEHLNTPSVVQSSSQDTEKRKGSQKTHIEKVQSANEQMKTLYESICAYIESLGDDITTNQLKLYLAYKKVQNFVCVEIYNKFIFLNLKLDPESVELKDGFTKNMRNTGQYGTGDLQVKIKNESDFENAKVLIDRAYNEN